jgi:hypothetical protein
VLSVGPMWIFIVLGTVNSCSVLLAIALKTDVELFLD